MSFQGDILPSEERRSARGPPPLRRLAVAAPSAPHPPLNHGYRVPHTRMGEIPVDGNTAFGSMVGPFQQLEQFQHPNQHEQPQRHYLNGPNGGVTSGVRPTEYQQLSSSINAGFSRGGDVPSGLQQGGPHSGANQLAGSHYAFGLSTDMGGGGGMGIDGTGGIGVMARGMGSEINDVGGMIDTPAVMSSSNWVGYDAASPGTHTSTFAANPTCFTPVGLKCKWDGCEYQGDFTSTWTLERHVKTFHIDMSKYVCWSCGATKARLDKFRQHINVECPILRLQNGWPHGM